MDGRALKNLALLPEAAARKLKELELAVGAAQDASRALVNRINGLPTRDVDAWLANRLAAQREQMAHRHADLHRLVSAILQWLEQPRLAGTVLEMAPPVTVELRSGQTVSAAIEAARGEVKAVRERLDATKRAGLPRDDLKKLAESYVLQLALQARPRIAVVNDQLRVSWRGDTAMVEDVAALFAFLSPDLFCAALQREIDQLPTRSDALSADQRKRRVAELEAALDKLERAEQALLDRAHEDGLDVLPRPDAAPSAVLGVIAVANKAKTEAAA
jgi:hypothetical protein